MPADEHGALASNPAPAGVHAGTGLHHDVFITGGTGYIGQRLIAHLAARGHPVRALTREQSKDKLPRGCSAVIGDALNDATYAHAVTPADTFIHLVGVPHPSPAKAAEFRRIDLVSAHAAVKAATSAAIRHFVYLSVAQPAPVMRAYLAARAEAEASIRASALNATILRPWYVLGPGHWWPLVLAPGYWIAERLPATRTTALRLGLVTVAQMVTALVAAVEEPAVGIRVVEVPDIRAAHVR
jgi:uncharacterized protein YbjT (DUF2867 family)